MKMPWAQHGSPVRNDTEGLLRILDIPLSLSLSLPLFLYLSLSFSLDQSLSLPLWSYFPLFLFLSLSPSSSPSLFLSQVICRRDHACIVCCFFFLYKNSQEEEGKRETQDSYGKEQRGEPSRVLVIVFDLALDQLYEHELVCSHVQLIERLLCIKTQFREHESPCGETSTKVFEDLEEEELDHLVSAKCKLRMHLPRLLSIMLLTHTCTHKLCRFGKFKCNFWLLWRSHSMACEIICLHLSSL